MVRIFPPPVIRFPLPVLRGPADIMLQDVVGRRSGTPARPKETQPAQVSRANPGRMSALEARVEVTCSRHLT